MAGSRKLDDATLPFASLAPVNMDESRLTKDSSLHEPESQEFDDDLTYIRRVVKHVHARTYQ